ncbi:MAG: hypothetical protein PHO41_01400 [Eubacteriales bacterium]|nr:hypothetical protein [Eubacteriales bacterium]
MAGKFQWQRFADTNVNDSFFNGLKTDYPEFSEWFARKSEEGKSSLVFSDDEGIGAFLYVKEEREEIILSDQVLPMLNRMKVGTLCLSERYRNQRIGEGALGVALWKWQESKAEEIFITVFEKHELLIILLKRFGFHWVGNNKRGERVYLRSRKAIDYSSPYTSFPFLPHDFSRAGLLPINDYFHDRLFPYSELMGNPGEVEESIAGNGITKVYVGTPSSQLHHRPGEPILIYRIHTGNGQKTYKSVATGFCTLTKIEYAKMAGKNILTLDEYLERASNKTVFTRHELTDVYSKHKNIVMLEMVYNGFFGKGHNITHRELDDAGFFPDYPYLIQYSRDSFIKILEMGDISVQNVIVD